MTNEGSKLTPLEFPYTLPIYHFFQLIENIVYTIFYCIEQNNSKYFQTGPKKIRSVSLISPCIFSHFTLETLITNINRNLNNFKSVMRIPANGIGTLIVSGVVPLRKFDNIQFKVIAVESNSFDVLENSTASIVVLGMLLCLLWS